MGDIDTTPVKIIIHKALESRVIEGRAAKKCGKMRIETAQLRCIDGCTRVTRKYLSIFKCFGCSTAHMYAHGKISPSSRIFDVLLSDGAKRLAQVNFQEILLCDNNEKDHCAL